jgi:NADH-quinone oxidoreductase subunit G
MNAEVNKSDLVTIEVDGVEMQVPKGSMVIEATDAARIDVPRFCYHKKLSIVANCRMCLVEVEQGGRPMPKPLPACATPVADGMKVLTSSPLAISAQKGVMEFLLINHPLDCPVCDQGGECELQDVALGYGRSVSRFTERKRIVDDEDMGPLIATEMTRCIHCTRCVRVLSEIAGQPELGLIGMGGRGEHNQISTYVENGVSSELSGNIIDVCPVGSLVDKPYRFTARAWEMLARPTVAPHDSVGSNINAHYTNGVIKRIVPRENDDVNECWISDRDRFSYQGVYSEDRLTRPMIKRNGQWEELGWEEALTATAESLRRVTTDSPEQLGALVSPTATTEEMYLLGKLMRGLGSRNIDHRLRHGDFSDQQEAPLHPYLGQSLVELEQLKTVLVIGAELRMQAPLLNHRLRKASLRGGKIDFINPRRYDINYDAGQRVIAPLAMPLELALVASAVAKARDASLPVGVEKLLGDHTPEDWHQDLAQRLVDAQPGAVLLGAIADAHPAGASLRALAALIAELAGARFGLVPEAANSVGGWLAGAVPHRSVGGSPESRPGLDARAMLEQPRQAYVLYNVEPEVDCWDPVAAMAAVDAAGFVLAFTPYVTERMKEYADILLPVGAFTETAGTFVNVEGRWQNFGGVAAPKGDARPGWRVLRVLGTLLGLPGFEQETVEEVFNEVRQQAGEFAPVPAPELGDVATATGALYRIGTVPIYAGDAVVRRAEALQRTVHAVPAAVHMNSEDANALGLAAGDRAVVRQTGEAKLAVMIDDSVPAGTVWIPAGMAETAALGPMFGEITVARA